MLLEVLVRHLVHIGADHRPVAEEVVRVVHRRRGRQLLYGLAHDRLLLVLAERRGRTARGI